MAPLRFGLGMAPANSEIGTVVTNQKSFLALRSRTLPSRSPVGAALLCLRWMAALTEARAPMTALEESKNAIPLSTSGFGSCVLVSSEYVKIPTPWKSVMTPPLALADVVICGRLKEPRAATNQRL